MSFWVVQGNQKGPTATQRLLLQELQGTKVEEAKKADEKGSHPQLLCSSRFYPLSWFWGVPCKKDLGTLGILVNARWKWCVYCYWDYFISGRALWASTRKKRDKTLILWSWRVVIQHEKSLLFIIFIFSSFSAYHTVPAHVKTRGCQVL